jgi:hypothetical protein
VPQGHQRPRRVESLCWRGWSRRGSVSSFGQLRGAVPIRAAEHSSRQPHPCQVRRCFGRQSMQPFPGVGRLPILLVEATDLVRALVLRGEVPVACFLIDDLETSRYLPARTPRSPLSKQGSSSPQTSAARRPQRPAAPIQPGLLRAATRSHVIPGPAARARLSAGSNQSRPRNVAVVITPRRARAPLVPPRDRPLVSRNA